MYDVVRYSSGKEREKNDNINDRYFDIQNTQILKQDHG